MPCQISPTGPKLLEIQRKKYISIAMKQIVAAIAFSLVGVAQAASQEADGTIILHRGTDAVEFYINFDAAEIEPLLNGDPAVYSDGYGFVDFNNFLVDTAFMGDALFDDVEAMVAGQSAQFYAMSFMLHPQELDVEFATPWEALSTITFCSVAPSQGLMQHDILRAYLGLTAYPVDGMGPVEIVFPETGRAARTFNVREFIDGNYFQSYPVTIADGGTFRAAAVDGPLVSQAYISLGTWLFYLGVLLVLSVGLGRTVEPEPTRKFNI